MVDHVGERSGDGTTAAAPHWFAWQQGVLGHAPGDRCRGTAFRRPGLHPLHIRLDGICKGATLTHRNATSYVDWCSEVFTPTKDDRFSSHAPFHFDLSILDIYVPIKHGARVDLIPDELGKNPRHLRLHCQPSDHGVVFHASHLESPGGVRTTGQGCLLLPLLFAGSIPAAAPYNRRRHADITTYTDRPRPTSAPTRRFPSPFRRIAPNPSHRMDLLTLPCPGARHRQSARAGREEGLLYISGPSVFSGLGKAEGKRRRVSRA